MTLDALARHPRFIRLEPDEHGFVLTFQGATIAGRAFEAAIRGPLDEIVAVVAALFASLDADDHATADAGGNA